MMDQIGFLEKEIFAYYGRAMFLAQCIEKSIVNLIIVKNHEKVITKERHDELLAHLTKKTFGELKREVLELNIFTELEMQDINLFHDKRDFLAHSFFWERTVEFCLENTQVELLDELNEIADQFQTLINHLETKLLAHIEKYKIDLEPIKNELIEEGKTKPLEVFRKLKRNETVIDLFAYSNSENSMLPIIEFDDHTFWTLCDSGLTQYKGQIIPSMKKKVTMLEGIFPILQFNPNPKVSEPWSFKLDLKKRGLKLIVKKQNEDFHMSWFIKKEHSSK